MEGQTFRKGIVTLMQFAWIQTFFATVKTGSLSRAADELNLTPPAAGKHIRRLEECLGTPLFIRSAHGMALNDVGKQLAAPFHEILNAWDEVQRVVSRPSKPVRIGTLPSLATTVAPRVLWNFHTIQRQQAELVLYSTSALITQAIIHGEVDMGFMDGRSAPSEYWNIPLFSESLVLAMGHKHHLAQCESVPLEALEVESLIMYPDSCDVRQGVEQHLQVHGRRLHATLEMPFGASLLTGVASGLGISVVPQSVMTHYDKTRIAWRRLENGPARNIVAVARSSQWGALLTACLPDFAVVQCE